MPKSFSIDLNQFTLYQGTPDDLTILQRPIVAFDVVASLQKLGYTNLDWLSEVEGLFCGTVGDMDQMLASATLGIPATAMVGLRGLGATRVLLLTFTY